MASWGERLTRIRTETTDVKRIVGYLPCGDEVEGVAVELEQAEHELRRVAVRPVSEKGVRRKERQRSIDQRRDRLHAHSERVSTAQPNAQLAL